MFAQFTREELSSTGIYMILNTINNHCYIGSADGSFRHRWNLHLCQLRNNTHHSNYLQKAWNKYKENAFKFVILQFTVKCDSNVYILRREQYYIDFYLPQYNMCKIAGSNKGIKVSEETRRKISVANSGKNNGMYGKRGEDSPSYGKLHSEDSIKKMSIVKLGKKHSQEHINKRALANKGKKRSEEIKTKMGNAIKNSKYHSKTFKLLSPEGVVYIVYNLNVFCKEHNLSRGNMTEVAQGNRAHHKKWKCEYYTPELADSK